jgi:hypothetical protein
MSAELSLDDIQRFALFVLQVGCTIGYDFHGNLSFDLVDEAIILVKWRIFMTKGVRFAKDGFSSHPEIETGLDDSAKP